MGFSWSWHQVQRTEILPYRPHKEFIWRHKVVHFVTTKNKKKMFLNCLVSSFNPFWPWKPLTNKSLYKKATLKAQIFWIGHKIFPNVHYIFDVYYIPLRRPKRSIFLGQGPVQGPPEEVQGPCARATKRGARASGFSKTLNQAFSTILLSVQFHWGARATQEVQGPLMCARASTFAFLPIYANDNQYDLVQGPRWEVQGPQWVVQGPQFFL